MWPLNHVYLLGSHLLPGKLLSLRSNRLVPIARALFLCTIMSVSVPARRQLTCVSLEPDCETPTVSCARWPEARCVTCCQPQKPTNTSLQAGFELRLETAGHKALSVISSRSVLFCCGFKHVGVFVGIWNKEAMFVLWSETRRRCLCCGLKQGGDVCVVSETRRQCLCCGLKQGGDVCVVVWNKEAMFVLWSEKRRRCLCCDLKQGGSVCVVVWKKERCLCCDLKQAMFVLWFETRRRCLFCDLKQGGSVCVVMAEGELLVHGVAMVLMIYRSFLCWQSICFRFLLWFNLQWAIRGVWRLTSFVEI